MRSYLTRNLLTLPKNDNALPNLTDEQRARRSMSIALGPTGAAWLLGRREHRQKFRRGGVIDFDLPRKMGATLARKWHWFFLAMDYLRLVDEDDGTPLRPRWKVDVLEEKPGKRTFRVRWMEWKSWRLERGSRAS